jgi:hypothetical protein
MLRPERNLNNSPSLIAPVLAELLYSPSGRPAFGLLGSSGCGTDPSSRLNSQKIRKILAFSKNQDKLKKAG